jgi:uncharacterized membrane protein YhaH (DUF805 family)
MSWNCPECNNINDSNTIRCICGYDLEANKNGEQKSIKIPEVEIDQNKSRSVKSSEPPETGREVPLFVRTCAVFLMVGSLAGLGHMGLAVSQAFKELLGRVDFWVILAIFVSCGVAGYALWKGDRRSVPWARILFGFQIPIFSTNPIIYLFFTGLGLGILVSHSNVDVTFSIGGEFQSFFNSSVPEEAIGINIIGLVCFLMLLKLRAQPAVTRTQMLLRSLRVRGRATRNEWWLWLVVFYLVPLFISVLSATVYVQIAKAIGQDPLPEFTLNIGRMGWAIFWNLTGKHMHLTMLISILGLVIFFGWLLLAASIRRLHDLNRNGWYVLIGLIPYLGAVILLVWLGLFREVPKDGEHNRFGDSPKLTGRNNEEHAPPEDS